MCWCAVKKLLTHFTDFDNFWDLEWGEFSHWLHARSYTYRYLWTKNIFAHDNRVVFFWETVGGLQLWPVGWLWKKFDPVSHILCDIGCQSDNALPSSSAFWPTSASTAWPHYACPSFMCRHRRKPVVHGCARLQQIHSSWHALAHATETGTSL